MSIVYQSVGIGTISSDRGFKFNPQFSYKGSVKMEGSMKDFITMVLFKYNTNVT